jgi:hypothetical protein
VDGDVDCSCTLALEMALKPALEKGASLQDAHLCAPKSKCYSTSGTVADLLRK